MTVRYLSLIQPALPQTHIALFHCGSSMDTLNVRWKFFEFYKINGRVIDQEESKTAIFFFFCLLAQDNTVDIDKHKPENSRLKGGLHNKKYNKINQQMFPSANTGQIINKLFFNT